MDRGRNVNLYNLGSCMVGVWKRVYIQVWGPLDSN